MWSLWWIVYTGIESLNNDRFIILNNKRSNSDGKRDSFFINNLRGDTTVMARKVKDIFENLLKANYVMNPI